MRILRRFAKPDGPLHDQLRPKRFEFPVRQSRRRLKNNNAKRGEQNERHLSHVAQKSRSNRETSTPALNPRIIHRLRNLEPKRVFASLLRTMTGNLDPDAALMLRVREGDREAFERLVDKYKQPVVRIVVRSFVDMSDA